ncbi:ribonuclease P protein component [Candidatus Poriferisocius sp.]|uniref:ribonuclease P protein component n=1 Tax=Candidatus Poriferisocius sp. TaxID=3101276 RepID=UPI003B5C4F8D
MRERSAFSRLTTEGIRTDHDRLWVRHVPDPSLAAAHVAYAIPRRVGTAVKRNTIRRRLRALVRDRDRDCPTGLAPGLYLIGVHRSDGRCSYADLRVSLAACWSRLGATAS